MVEVSFIPLIYIIVILICIIIYLNQSSERNMIKFFFSYLRANNLILTKLILSVNHFIFQVKIKSYKFYFTIGLRHYEVT
jgi:hypothetical protein